MGKLFKDNKFAQSATPIFLFGFVFFIGCEKNAVCHHLRTKSLSRLN